MLLFFSDGVLGECEDAAWLLDTVRCVMERTRSEEKWAEEKKPSGGFLDRAAAKLGEEAKKKNGRRDDMTAAILKITKEAI